jgi:hypothetical protein
VCYPWGMADDAPEAGLPESPDGRAANRTLAEMIGDTLREAALLVAVFGWLDRVVQQEPFWGTWAWTVLGGAMALYVMGVAIERLRSPE